MSKTDIFPPESYSLPTDCATSLTFWNFSRKTWNEPIIGSQRTYGLTGTLMRRGESTPGFKFKASQGQLPENAFSFSCTDRKAFYGVEKYEKPESEKWECTGYRSASFCSLDPRWSLSSARMFNLDNGAKQKVLERIRDSDVNLAVDWAEREKTMKMLTQSVKRLGSAYSYAKRGDFASASRALGVSLGTRGAVRSGTKAFTKRTFKKQAQSIASGWLELQYGWRPLVNSIYGSLQILEKHRKEMKEFVIVRSRKAIQEEQTVEKHYPQYVDTILTEEVYTVKCFVKMSRSSSVVILLTDVGLTNPAYVAWELVPFSFVADWVVPIGSFLSQFDSALGWNLSSGSITRVTDRTATLTRAPAAASGYTYYYVNGQASEKTFICTRTGIGDFPDLHSLPFIKNPLSVEHALNALALLKTSKR